MSDALAVLAIYLTLATLLMTTCFGRVEAWYARVHEARESWRDIEQRNMPLEQTRRHHRRVSELRSSMPWRSTLFVIGLLAVISITSFLLGREIKSPRFSLSYIWGPGAIFEISFIAACILLMWKGRRITSEMEPK